MASYMNLIHTESAMINTTALVYDNQFGPFLTIPGKITFDFTLLFEETILSILPSAILLLLIPPRIWQLWQSSRKVTRSNLQKTKIVRPWCANICDKANEIQVLLILYSVFQVVNVVEVAQSSLQTRASLAAALLTLLSALGLCILSYAEHTRNIRPSSIINAYLILTVPFDATQLRTRWLRGGNPAGNGVASAMLGVKLLILISEATEKKRLLVAPYANPAPEATSGLYSRGVFWWLNPLLRLGFSNVVSEDDLFTADRDLLSDTIAFKFRKHWHNRDKYPKNHRLVWVLARTMLKPFAAGIIPRLALTFFLFMQPLLISNITQLISESQNEGNSQSAENRGWGLTAAFALVYVGIALAGGAFYHKCNRLLTMVRGALVSAIYTQTIDLSITSIEESAAVTLMSSDVERTFNAVESIHHVWSSPMELALAIWLLEKQIGLALLGPIVIIIIPLSGPFFIAKSMGHAQRSWVEKIQTRIDATAKMLNSMKGVKMLGLGSKMSDLILQLRLDEVTESFKWRKLFVVNTVFGNMADIFVPGAAFCVYVIVATVNGQQLDVTSAFTALSLITLLVAPIRAIVFVVPTIMAALGCFDRIETYLTLPTKKDHRMFLTDAKERLGGQATVNITGTSTPLGADIELEDITRPVSSGLSSATVQVRDLTLSWSEGGNTVINEISFDFRPGTLTMIVGPVGCGKSSLLKGLLGETPSSKGSILVDQPYAAFVDQTPWIQNRSIKQNILGIADLEPEWYAKVISACALDTDLDELPNGDGTTAGSAGAALSGGQKLRVALARAVYSRKRVILLDDVFSGLDAIREEAIFSRLLGKSGLLRRLGTTVILVTHGAHRLAYADHIIALDDSGKISEQGRFDHLLASDGYVAGLTANYIREQGNPEEEEAAPMKAAEDNDTARENAATDLKRATGDWATYDYYFRNAGWHYVLIYAGLITFYTIVLRFPDLWVKFWTGAIAVHGNSVNGFYLGILIGAEFIAIAVLMVVIALQFLRLVPRSAINLHKVLLNTVENAPLSFFTSTDSGQIVNRFSQDLSIIDFELPLSMLVLAFMVCVMVIQSVLISISAAYFAILLPFVAIVGYFLQKFYLRTSRQIRLMDLEAKAPLYTNFLETLSGLVTIRAFGWGNEMEKRNMKLLDTSQRPFYLLYCIQRWLAIVVDLIVASLAVTLVALIVRFRHSADAGLVGVALINVMLFNASLSEVIKNWTAIETSLGAVARIKSFVTNTPCENLPQESQQVPMNWPSKGSISFSKVSASYDPASLPSALHNINLTIDPGQKIGICGPSGSGKSSLVSLLLHMLETITGQTTIDGIDISTIPRATLRERLIVIPQDPIFIRGSIHENLDLSLSDAHAAEAATEAAEFVLRAVNLWTVISAAGGLTARMDAENQLSQGQRQLFCLARAMLKFSSLNRRNPNHHHGFHQEGGDNLHNEAGGGKILLLDEATANVDLATDEIMQRVIAEHFASCTVVAVAHRLRTIRHYDRVAVMAEGKVVEFGEPGELLAQEGGGRFKELWDKA